MSISIVQLRAATTFVALSGELTAQQLSAEAQAGTLQAVAAVSVLAATLSVAKLDAIATSVVLAAIGELGDFIQSRRADDVAHAHDAMVMSLDHAEAEYVAVRDAIEIVKTKGLADIALAADALSIASMKALADGLATADSVSMAAGKAFAEMAHAIDRIESITMTKQLADTVVASEFFTTSAGGGSIPDTVAAFESMALSLARAISDAAHATDSGVVSLSDYADDYFDGDYVLTDVQTF